MPRHFLNWVGGVIGGLALIAAAPSQAATIPATNAAIAQQLRSFQTTGTVLHIAAHPDDENTQLITYLARGRGYRTAYLSLTRGDGGQNELGRDFDEKLGVARTQELLAARRLDGGRQFFSRAIDFGFSKSPEETLEFWGRDAVLSDVVRVIRQFRPDVIVTRFPVPPGSGGHGHHTASAILAVEAFKLAGDPKAFPEQLTQGLTPWQPKRVVWNAWGGNRGNAGLTGPTVEMDIGGKDPVTGESFGTIANRSRGMHKTQGLGGFSAQTSSGPNLQTFLLLAGEPAKTDLMDGVEVTWDRIRGGAEIARLAHKASDQFKLDDPAASLPALLAIRKKLATFPSDPLVDDKRAQLDAIIQACLGLTIDTTVEQAEVVPGEPLKLHYAMTMLAENVAVRRLSVRSPNLTKLDLHEPPVSELVAGAVITGDFTAVLPKTAPITQPYWLREDWTTGVFRVDDPALIGQPENPPSVTLEHTFEIDNQKFVVIDEPVQVTHDDQGEHTRRIDVIPPVSISFATALTRFAPGQERQVVIELTAARADTAGVVKLEAPAGWTVAPATRKFRLNNAAEKAQYAFAITAPAQPSSGRFTASVEIGGQRFSFHREEVRYEHIPVQLLQPVARARAVAFPLATQGRKVGYLPGAGDSVAENLEQMGYPVKTLTGAELTSEAVDQLDAIVVGVRAFNERTDLAPNLSALWAYVERGGTVIVQYNRPNGLNTPTLAPYPLSIQGPAPQFRVTDEKSPVTFLAPNHPALNRPNKITPADFENWVQERGAYFPSSWDQTHFTPLLALNDPGEEPLKGSVLVAPYGKGHFVYTGLAFFRQLPAGVPGAFRLLANLIALGKSAEAPPAAAAP